MVGMILVGRRVAFFEGSQPSDEDARDLLISATTEEFEERCGRLRLIYVPGNPIPDGLAPEDLGWRIILDLPPELANDVESTRIFRALQERQFNADMVLQTLRMMIPNVARSLDRFAAGAIEMAYDIIRYHPVSASVDPERDSWMELHKERGREFMLSELSAKARHGLECACVVFAHSILDSTVQDLIKVSMLKEPNCWKGDVQEHSFTLEEVACSSATDLLNSALQQYAKKLNRDSLPNRAQKLLSRCPPDPTVVAGWPQFAKYKFSREQLRTADELRHSIVHGVALQDEKVNDAGDVITFIQLTTLYLIAVVGEHYRLTHTSSSYARFSAELPDSIRLRWELA